MAAKRFLPQRTRFIIGSGMNRINRDAIVHQRRANGILRGQTVGAGHIEFGAAARKRFHQIGGLGLQMNRQRDAQPGKRLFDCKAIADGIQNRHMALNPSDALVPLFL